MALNLCQPGLLLRALLVVHGALAIGCAFGADSLLSWWALFAAAAGPCWPAVLLWAGGVCLLDRRLARAGRPWSARLDALAVGWGAVSAVVAWWGWQMLQPLGWAPSSEPGLRPLAHAAAGAAAAAGLLGWAKARAQRAQPEAHTARLIELQARIRPHFLFNSLNTAIALVRVDPSRAESVLEDLSELFRAALQTDEPAGGSTLGAEIALAQRYLAIEQLRFGARLQVQWELDEAAAVARVPLLLMQPLLENAVRHGVEPDPEGGHIVVRTLARPALRQAWVRVHNTLPGSIAATGAATGAAAGAAAGSSAGASARSSTPSTASTAGHGMALRNVRERLALMHDLAAHFEAGERDGAFVVEFAVPL